MVVTHNLVECIYLPASTSSPKPTHCQFWTLAIFIAILFFTGGASRVDEQSLLLLRPLSVIVCAIALLTLKREHLAERQWLLAGFASIVILCILHLIPLPSSVWQGLPGREIIVEVDRLAALGDLWRPLTITPMNGWHALASLSTPLAVLLLGVQLDKANLYRLLPILLALAVLSGFTGMLQIMGDAKGPLYLYRITNNGSAVGLFANRNHAAVLLTCLFPVLATYASVSMGSVDQQRIKQFTALAACIILVPLILVTGSRSGMLLALPALVATALLYRKPVTGRIVRRGHTRFKLALGHVVAGGGVVSLFLLTIFYSRAEAWNRLFTESAVEGGRADFWRVGMQLIWTYFPFGSGIGSFVEVYQHHEPSRDLQPSYVNHLHNDWLETVLTGGIPAAIILLVASAFFIFRSVKLWQRNDQDRRTIKIARLGSVLIAMLALASIADYPLRTPIMMGVFAIACLWFTLPAVAEHSRERNVSVDR